MKTKTTKKKKLSKIDVGLWLAPAQMILKPNEYLKMGKVDFDEKGDPTYYYTIHTKKNARFY